MLPLSMITLSTKAKDELVLMLIKSTLCLFLLLLSNSVYAAQVVTNKECIDCHGTRDILKMTDDEKSAMVISDPQKKTPKKSTFDLFLDNRQFTSSVHGQLQCTDCHVTIREIPHSQRLGAVDCKGCHASAVDQYTNSNHARASGTFCIDCHNPHKAITYRRLSLTERSAICLQCHKKGGHEWLPEGELHFNSLECTVCHAQGAKKELLLYFSGIKRRPLTHEQMKTALGKQKSDTARLLDANRDKTVELSEIKRFLTTLETGGIQSPRLAGDGLVSEVHHGFTSQVNEAKDCTMCHSPKTFFYSRTMLKLPLKDGWQTFPVEKGVAAKTSPIPARENYFTTVHAKKGVKCIDCHAFQNIVREGTRFKVKEIEELVCGTRCHTEIMNEYRASVHYKAHEHFCLDCHEPHPNVPYAQLNATERRSICLRCHKDTEKQHKFQAQQTLHCQFVECTMCHSPKAAKGIVFYLRGIDSRGQGKRLDNKDVVELIGLDRQGLSGFIDRNGDKMLDEGEVTAFLKSLNNPKVLREKGFERIDIGINLLVLRPFHNFTEKLTKAKDCSLCHSAEGEGMESLVLQIPESDKEIVSVPVKKEALVAFLPLPGIGNFYLLGGKKLSKEDIRLLWSAPLSEAIQGLGYKWIDIVGFLFILGAAGFVGVHGFLRVLTRRVRAQKKRGRK